MCCVKNGVQAHIKGVSKKALYVHSLAHNLNLCLIDIASTCEMIRNVMSSIYNLVQLIRFSPKRLSMFDSLRKSVSIQNGETTPSLLILCPTRWTVPHMSIHAILSNYAVLQAALEDIRGGREEYASKTNGLLKKWKHLIHS